MKARYSIDFETQTNEDNTIKIIEIITNELSKAMFDLSATNILPKFEIVDE